MLEGHGHWKKVEWGGVESNLKVGDILIRSDVYRNYIPPTGKQRGHIVMYVGHDLIAKYHPTAANNSTFVSASYLTRSPGCGPWEAEYATYECFRVTYPEENSRYANIVPYVLE